MKREQAQKGSCLAEPAAACRPASCILHGVFFSDQQKVAGPTPIPSVRFHAEIDSLWPSVYTQC